VSTLPVWFVNEAWPGAGELQVESSCVFYLTVHAEKWDPTPAGCFFAGKLGKFGLKIGLLRKCLFGIEAGILPDATYFSGMSTAFSFHMASTAHAIEVIQQERAGAEHDLSLFFSDTRVESVPVLLAEPAAIAAMDRAQKEFEEIADYALKESRVGPRMIRTDPDES
jgi:hypothetical protein